MRRGAAHVCALLLCLAALGAAARSGNASSRLRMIDGRPLVDVIVNGQGPYRFLLDTGTSVNMIDPKLARAAGLTASFETTVTSTTGTTKLPGLDDVELAVGSARAGRQIVLIGGLDAVRQLSPDIQGVVGQSFLSGFDYLIDLETSRLVFGPQDADGARVPMTIVNGRPAVETSLGRLLLDSGAHGLVLLESVSF